MLQYQDLHCKIQMRYLIKILTKESQQKEQDSQRVRFQLRAHSPERKAETVLMFGSY